MHKKKIALFTGNRAEYGLLRPLVKELLSRRNFDVRLIISGSHLSERFGNTHSEIEYPDRLKAKNVYLSQPGTPDNVLPVFAELVKKGARLLGAMRPDILVLAGDRYETYAMAIAAFYSNIPIAHLFGGDLSQGGNLDDSVRHSITKLSHLHFVSNQDSYLRVLGLGEEKWRVFNVGSTAIDNYLSGEYAGPQELARELKIDPGKQVIVFTQHPVTTESALAYGQIKESLEALKEFGRQTVITYPCNDAGGDRMIKAIKEYARVPHFRIRKSLGWKNYFGILRIASAVAGNSSSGIMETPVFKVACINIGSRQQGRLRAENVIDVPYKKRAILEALRKAVSDKAFLRKVRNCRNPYGSGRAAEKIADELEKAAQGKRLLQKKMTY
ncbi:MAG: UDP-N-acetylglucosamine 2-epimerase [Candidatus Omnitrophica bacterium]|nr:UDP-N-acetylglucosamine 2-epimerase [Candidatus Omnitrophota bacterium]MDD5310558.1 UDP-N-acetylglucosamine 2-epimerase [Candidatus Omnitrophota bacterium]MDD5546016.1 UDP-N-acetylglucosamine 2-epimerase [Candidatus Omnitrophota bacterium]